MTRLVRYYRTLVGAELAATAAYRAQLVIGLFGWVVPFVMIALWRGAAGGGTIEGISGAQFTTYFVGVLVITSTGVAGALVFGFGFMVHSGRLSTLLLRPFHPLHALIAHQVAENLVRLVPLIAVAVTTVVILDGAVSSDPIAWLLAVMLYALGYLQSIYLAAIVGAASLWLTKSEGAQGLLFGVEWILGGIVAPTALLPGALSAFARISPFWLSIGAPSELISGILEPAGGTRALALAVVWTVALHLAFAEVWRRGMRRFEAVGT